MNLWKNVNTKKYIRTPLNQHHILAYNTHQLANITGGNWIQLAHEGFVAGFCLDSRKITATTEMAFMAISGKNHDGHKYAQYAYSKGIRTFIVEKYIDVNNYQGANILVVDNATLAFQKMASHHRHQFKLPVIGITGSNGKTIVKEWLNTMLAEDFRIVRSPKSYNSQIGVPLSVWNIDENHTLGIFEAGISQSNEMANLEKVIAPQIGVIVNIGNAHLENFHNTQELADEKVQLCAHSDTIIYSSDYPEISNALAKKEYQNAIKIPWSLKHNEAQLAFSEIRKSNDRTEISGIWKARKVRFIVPFTDDASIENCVCCIAIMLHLKYQEEVINERLSRLTKVAMRLEVLNGINHSVLINDAYSSDLHSLEIALDFLNQQSHGRKKIVILSDIVQSGLVAAELIQRVQDILVTKKTDQLIAIGPAFIENQSALRLPHQIFSGTNEFLAALQAENFTDSIILIKGARDFKFERIVDRLQEQAHDTVLEINLNAMTHNLNYFRARLSPGVKMMVMVKAFGYGSGAIEVSKLLEFNQIDYLAVAYADEGVALRRSGVSVPIMIMNPDHHSFATIIRHNLEPEIYSFRTLQLFLEALHSSPFAGDYPIHIKLDTGMHRLGFEAFEMDKLCKELLLASRVKIQSVFTHLAASDSAIFDSFTRDQLSLFDRLSAEICTKLNTNFMRHAANTGGIQRFPESQYDMVRLGIGLYGVSADESEQNQLETVGTLKTIISQIKHIQPGDSVGYSRKFIADKPTTIATIPLGYADGLRRSLGNGAGLVMIKNQKCKIVGNVCMDMTMVDITNIEVEEGQEVIIFGVGQSLKEIADQCGTIPYEILTSISQRVKRIYLSE
jgi:Alr-MurF fusion protein